MYMHIRYPAVGDIYFFLSFDRKRNRIKKRQRYVFIIRTGIACQNQDRETGSIPVCILSCDYQ